MICLGYEGITEYYLDNKVGVALVRTSWVNQHKVDSIGYPSIIRTRVWVIFAIRGGKFRVLSYLNLVSVLEIRSMNLVKSWIFWISIYILSQNSFISLSYKLFFYSNLAILPRVIYCKNLSLKSKNNSFEYIQNFLYIDYILAYSQGFRRLITRKLIIVS